MSTVHQAVLEDEVLSFMKKENIAKKFILIFDGTLGGAGHSYRILEEIPEAFLIAVDQDLLAVNRAKQRLVNFEKRCFLTQANFSKINQVLEDLPLEVQDKLNKESDSSFPKFDRILLDLGISSDQLADATRGFSFLYNGPLDMRMNSSQGLTADEVVNQYTEQQLAQVFLKGGVNPPLHRVLTKAIIKNRPINSTKALADLCSAVIYPSRKKVKKKQGSVKKHPATVVFQALRMEVNQEIPVLENFMGNAIDLLAPEGRLAIISFHSLEDKVVTHTMRKWEQTAISPVDYFQKTRPKTLGKLLTKKAVCPTEQEINRNIRSRSARLRVFEKGDDNVNT